MPEIVKIHIYDQEYDLRINSDSGLQRLERVTELVDRKMRDVSARYLNLTAKEVAVLAALNLADDYIELQERLSVGSDDLAVDQGAGERMLECAQRINSYLGEN